jgi:hypothetical protein
MVFAVNSIHHMTHNAIDTAWTDLSHLFLSLLVTVTHIPIQLIHEVVTLRSNLRRYFIFILRRYFITELRFYRMPEHSNIEVSQTSACALNGQLCEDLCITVTTFIGFLAGVETDMVIQSTTLWELRNTGIIFAGSLCGSNYHYHLQRIVHHRYHICRVLPVWIQTCFFKLPLTVNCAQHESRM